MVVNSEGVGGDGSLLMELLIYTNNLELDATASV